MLVNEYKPEIYDRKVRKMRNLGNVYICGSLFVMCRTDAQITDFTASLTIAEGALILFYCHHALPFKLGDSGSILGRTSTQGLKIIEEKVLPLH